MLSGLSKSMLFCAFFLPCLVVCSCLLSYLLLALPQHTSSRYPELSRILIINGPCCAIFTEISKFLKDSDSGQSLVRPNKYLRCL